MSSEAFTTAMFLIAAIISAGVLINAVFPVIYTLSGTIASSSHKVDERLSVDVKIVTTYASDRNDTARIWIKNVGTGRIAGTEIRKADVFLGGQGDFVRLTWKEAVTDGAWTHEILEDTNNYWDPGETLYIEAETQKIPATESVVYFQFVLPTGLSRSTTFNAGD
ncbi:MULTISPECIES: flagellin [unclassified Methanoculleus]|uniref:flagellin n=1 Tax=unclassified Methanoculleus TaxID=2619537 RepID=UPI0026003566|nr:MULTISPECIES: flagellin [unclassified Methanoculleus]MCK9319527.1 flagellin [Methanoculleus sp.]MDD2255297.1 flagellin [Methanoculleus sp.]MDD2788433.1 flagellin [Methanoculleus sp.]MDD3217451.1 flagellin [Methanoculleus sp.]MDD4315308.1 flagellin [Methanoculleus sp.]